MSIYEVIQKYSSSYRCVFQDERETRIIMDNYPMITIEMPTQERQYYLVRFEGTGAWVHIVNMISKRDKLNINDLCCLLCKTTAKFTNQEVSMISLEKNIRSNQSNQNELLIKEYLNTITNLDKTHIKITIIDNLIDTWHISMFGFSNKNITEQVKMKIQFNMLKYPISPPTIAHILPSMANSLHLRLMNIDLIRAQHWNPARSIRFIIGKIYGIINDRAKPIVNKCFDEKIDEIILQITSISEIISIDDMKCTNNVPHTPGSGTGYQSSTIWNIDSYLKEQDDKRHRLTKLYHDLLHEFQRLPDKKVLIGLQDNEIIQCIQSSLDDMTPSTIDTFGELYENIIRIILLFPQSITQLFQPSIQRISVFVNCKTCVLRLEKHEKDMFNSLGKSNEVIEVPKRDTYDSHMEKYRFGESDILNNNYYQAYMGVVNGKLLSSAVKRLSNEFSSLAVDLPINKTSSIFVRVDPSNMSVIRAMIIGPKDTPYENGCFIFDIKIPTNYPTQHPDIHFMNHGGVRFNPNLYACGKVCLSLIGTWGDRQQNNSENWQPATSTIFQLLLSVQSQILVEKPFFNEPAYYGKESIYVRENSEYNHTIEYYTLHHAIVDVLKTQCYGDFTEIIKEHLKLNAPEIKERYKNLYYDKDNVLYKQCIGLLDSL